MIQDPVRRTRLRSTLIIVILSTIPCYLLGLIILWISSSANGNITPTPTITVEIMAPTAVMSATLPQPTVKFDTPTITLTPTISVTPSITATYFIPSPTPSMTFTATETLIATDTPLPVETNTPEVIPSDTQVP